MKTLLKIFIAFSVLFMFSGCVTKYVYIQPEYPYIPVMSTVPTIKGPKADGTIPKENVKPLLEGCSDLRKRTDYYEYMIPKYNEDYNTTK